MEFRFVTARSTRDLDLTLRAGNTESALDDLQRAGAHDAGGFFSFRVGEAMMDLDAAPYGGARYPVEARLDGRTFAEIQAPSIAMIAREQQFAEKIHAYTVPRPGPNSRVRDLVDLRLLIASGSLDASRCAEALRRTFERRNTHELPKELVPPAADWDRPFRVLAEECGIDIWIPGGVRYVAPLLGRAVTELCARPICLSAFGILWCVANTIGCAT